MAETLKAERIPIGEVRVLNPRSRGRRSHDEIVESIGALGLKRPITVSRRAGADGYDLVCGQGRLEAYQRLGQSQIPAVILDLTEEECLVRSLVENVARRRHAGAELLGDISNLRARGYSDEEIARKIGFSASWVAKVALLLERGEGELIKAVECGYLPVSLAVTIACEPDEEIQRLLTDAYRAGLVKTGDVPRIRKLLERRTVEAQSTDEPRSPHDFAQTLLKQAERQRVALKRADLLQTRLAFVVEALRDLWSDPGCARILSAEGLAEAPKALSDRVLEGRHDRS